MQSADKFLNLLDANAKFLFQTFDDKHIERRLTRTLYGTYKECEDILRQLNEAGAGVYVTVNETKGNRRRKEDFIHARAIWQEDDNNNEIDFPVLPHIVIRTSPNHYHRYWLLEDFPVSEMAALTSWEKTQTAMVTQYGSDPGAKDIARVMRLPGFWNHKYDSKCLVELQVIRPNLPRWKLTDLALKLFPKGDKPTEATAADLVITNTPKAITSNDQVSVNESAALSQSTQTLDQYIQQIQAGEHLHTPLRAIMLINANKGFDLAFNKVICLGLINSCPDNSRKQRALHDLDAMLKATYGKLTNELGELVTLEDLPKGVLDAPDLPWPPGLLGELATAANEFFVVPNKTVAIMTSIMLIAGIVGRRYNISASGLNLYTTIMMPTGAGKDSIRKFCQRVLMDKSMLGTNGMSFLGSQNFTGPKALIGALHDRPSQLCIMTEAGLLYKSEAGDKAGLTRVILQAYTSSGQYELIAPESYSTAQDSLPTVYSPALSILNEATPVTLLNELHKRESINTGELPRMWIFNMTDKKAYNNDVPHVLKISAPVIQKIKDLLQDCYTVQNNEIPRVIDLPMPPQFREFSRYCTDRYNELISEEPNKAVMYTRAAHKVLKTAAVVAVFNSPKGGTSQPPFIDAPTWEWTRQLLDYEMHLLPSVITDNKDVDLALDAAIQAIAKLLSSEYTSSSINRNRRIPEQLRTRGMFTESTFKQATAGTKAIKDAGTSLRYGNPKSGAMVILQYMQNEGYIQPVKQIPGYTIRQGQKVYKITQILKHRWEELS